MPGFDRALAALRAGGLAVLPTETVYGVAAGRSGRGALDQLLRAASTGDDAPRSPPTWHTADPQDVIGAWALTDPMHRRIVRRLLPGPVRLVYRPAPGAGVAELAARVPAHAVTRALLRAAGDGAPIVLERLASLGIADDHRISGGARQRLAELGIGAVIDDGPTTFGQPSTTVRLLVRGPGLSGPAYEVVSVGAMDPRRIARRVERLILFVCTGNTCRSPMAEALARRELSGRAGVTTRAESAGVAAGQGQPMTPDAAYALRGLGVDPGRHRSRPLTRELVDEAEVIFAMTPGHARTVEAVAPGSSEKVRLLDPAGREIPDPIGLPSSVYESTARAMRQMIRDQLDRLDADDRVA